MGICFGTEAAAVTTSNEGEGDVSKDKTSSGEQPQPQAKISTTSTVPFTESLSPLKTFKSKKKIEEGEKEPLRLLNIVAKPLKRIAAYVAPVHEKTEEEKEIIRNAVHENFVFSHLLEKEMQELVNAVEPISVEKDTVIIRQGEVGDYFYIVKTGIVEFTVDGRNVGKAKNGTTFGELALLYNGTRAATCTALEACELYRLEQETFRRILMSTEVNKEEEKVEVLKTVDVFKNFDLPELEKIATVLEEQSFKADTMIKKRGDAGDTFYIVKEGSIIITDIQVGESKYTDLVVGRGESFGEKAIQSGMPVNANVKAQTDCALYTISRANFLKHLGSYDIIANRVRTKDYLRNVPIIAKADLSQKDFDKLVGLFSTAVFSKDFVFSTIGDKIEPTLYLIQSGSVSRKNHNGKTTTLGQNEYFGDDAFEIGKTRVTSRYTITALEDTTCQVLTFSSVRIAFSRLGASISGDSKDDEHLDSSLDLSNLEKHRILGAGTFGQVWLVTDKRNKKAYALKIQSKRLLVDYDQNEGVIREKDIMARLHSPFIIQLTNAFQDKKCLYMVTKLYLGGELFGVLQRNKQLTNSEAIFYSASVFEGLAFMHRRKILYRDLKPENVLLDSDGYCVIVDLGFAKIVRNKTYTLCGTPLYIAPEVILQRGHDKGADIWSFGVLVYELVYGRTPFYTDGMDQKELFENICKAKYSFPKNEHASPEVIRLIKALLVRRSTQRLGCLSGGDADVRNEPFFRNMNFYELRGKGIKAPWIPPIKDPLDSSNFEPWRDEIANYNKDKPLTKEEQALFESF